MVIAIAIAVAVAAAIAIAASVAVAVVAVAVAAAMYLGHAFSSIQIDVHNDLRVELSLLIPTSTWPNQSDPNHLTNAGWIVQSQCSS